MRATGAPPSTTKSSARRVGSIIGVNAATSARTIAFAAAERASNAEVLSDSCPPALACGSPGCPARGGADVRGQEEYPGRGARGLRAGASAPSEFASGRPQRGTPAGLQRDAGGARPGPLPPVLRARAKLSREPPPLRARPRRRAAFLRARPPTSESRVRASLSKAAGDAVAATPFRIGRGGSSAARPAPRAAPS